MWLVEALRLSPLGQRDEALASLVQLIQAGGGRRKEAVDLIVRYGAHSSAIIDRKMIPTK